MDSAGRAGSRRSVGSIAQRAARRVIYVWLILIRSAGSRTSSWVFKGINHKVNLSQVCCIERYGLCLDVKSVAKKVLIKRHRSSSVGRLAGRSIGAKVHAVNE